MQCVTRSCNSVISDVVLKTSFDKLIQKQYCDSQKNTPNLRLAPVTDLCHAVPRPRQTSWCAKCRRFQGKVKMMEIIIITTVTIVTVFVPRSPTVDNSRENFVKFEHALFEICERTDRQTDRHAHRNTSCPSRGEVAILTGSTNCRRLSAESHKCD